MGLFAIKRRPRPQWYIAMFPLKRVNYYLIYRDTVFSDKSKEVHAGLSAFASNLEGNPLVSIFWCCADCACWCQGFPPAR